MALFERLMPCNCMIAALAYVSAILFWGLITMTGGEYNRNNSNKIMRYRITLQAAAW